MTSTQGLHTTQPEECGIPFPDEYLKLAKTQGILVRGDFIYPDSVGPCSFKSKTGYIRPLPCRKIHPSEV